ncbi:hypothetical protein V7O66_11365 [Methanolobus sp. ZRKC3]|uniref:hypothetical protein n=1 Tax=Methanolobus sp. ZRKC3 TaxID=3125786 RepID=UPI00324E9916
MTLPDVCPKDEAAQCKGSECHLYVVDWRSGDEQCIIGYRFTRKSISVIPPAEDTYAETTRRRAGRNTGHVIADHPSSVEQFKAEPANSEAAESLQTRKLEVLREKVVVNNKDTMVFESTLVTEDVPREQKKRKSIDEVMDLDLPDGYEEEFWK